MLRLENLIGDRLYLDYMITTLFAFSYENGQINVDYQSHITLDQIDLQINELSTQLQNEESQTTPDQDTLAALKEGIVILQDLKTRLI
jgi:hypothetical protein